MVLLPPLSPQTCVLSRMLQTLHNSILLQLAGADSVEETIDLQDQLQKLFGQGGFLLRKWNCSEQAVLQHIPSDLRDSQSTLSIPFTEEYTKTLGVDVEWNSNLDHFRLTFSQPPSLEKVTKRGLISDVAKTFDVLGWFSPAIIKVKILFQRLWEMKVDRNDPVPSSVHEPWLQWRSELHLLSEHHIPRCYFLKDARISTMQLHGFSDASERAYAGVVYLRMVYTEGRVHVSLVMSKTKVAPIKRLTIPRLELCGAHLLAQILHHTQELFHITPDNIFAYNCTWLAFWQPQKVQNLCWKQNLWHHGVCLISGIISMGLRTLRTVHHVDCFPRNCWSTHSGGMVQSGSVQNNPLGQNNQAVMTLHSPMKRERDMFSHYCHTNHSSHHPGPLFLIHQNEMCYSVGVQICEQLPGSQARSHQTHLIPIPHGARAGCSSQLLDSYSTIGSLYTGD